MGKHKDTDKQTGFWVDADLLEKVQEILKRNGLTLSDEIRKMMENILKEEIKKQRKENEKRK
jgi:antitoxin component of RelBE/YafQ-DinJ toxin-antitoxin module